MQSLQKLLRRSGWRVARELGEWWALGCRWGSALGIVNLKAQSVDIRNVLTSGRHEAHTRHRQLQKQCPARQQPQPQQREE
jgi:hypothetical protein